MEVYASERLEKMVKESLQGIEAKRDIFTQMDEYITGKNDRKIMCLYGLRRTGKTIMMLQEIESINDYSKVLYLLCENTRSYKNAENKELVETVDTIHDIKNTIASFPECRYVFIDEVTKTADFIKAGSVIADSIASEGRKVVVAGTDSLGFVFAGKDELYDRMHFLHTTYIPFKEYNRILGKDLMDYIRYGGTLTPENVFYNKDSLNEYSSSAIIDNIVNSIRKVTNPERGQSVLEKMIVRNELQTAISKVLEYPTKEFLEEIINMDFKSNNLGSLVDLMNKHDIADRGESLNKEDMHDRIRAFLNIRANPFYTVNENTVFNIIKLLVTIDVLYKIPSNSYLKRPDNDEYIFIQPGMKYGQALSIAQALITSESFNGYSVSDQKKILLKLESDICGNLLEEIIFYQLGVDLHANDLSSTYSVTKYRNVLGDEADILLLNHSTQSVLEIEVKLSETCNHNQLKHIANSEFSQEIEELCGMKIINQIVIYRGPTCDYEGYIYLNAEEFLLNTNRISKILTTTRCETVSRLKNPSPSSPKKTRESNLTDITLE